MGGPAGAQLLELTLDQRDPLELSSGNDPDQDLTLTAALYEAPREIRVHVGPGDGSGPFQVEIAVASGDPYFALSRRIFCRAGSCYFSAVNGTTSQVELFTRSAAGVWTRSPVTPGGSYFNSDLGLNDNAITVLAYDAIQFEMEIWRSVADGPFQQVAVHAGAAGAIYGALRASLSTDITSPGDYLVLFDDVASLPTPDMQDTVGGLSVLAGDWYPPAPALHTRQIPRSRSIGQAAVRLEGDLSGFPAKYVLELITVPASGGPESRRESMSIDACGFKFSFWINTSGQLQGQGVDDQGRRLGDPITFDHAPPTPYSESVITTLKFPGVDDLFLLLIPPEQAWLVGVDPKDDPPIVRRRNISSDVYPSALQPFGFGPLSAMVAGFGQIGVTGVGSTRYLLLDLPEGFPEIVDIPTLGSAGAFALILLLSFAACCRLRRWAKR